MVDKYLTKLFVNKTDINLQVVIVSQEKNKISWGHHYCFHLDAKSYKNIVYSNRKFPKIYRISVSDVDDMSQKNVYDYLDYQLHEQIDSIDTVIFYNDLDVIKIECRSRL